MTTKVYVAGVGMTKFDKPGKNGRDYPDMAREAGTAALHDAAILAPQCGVVSTGFSQEVPALIWRAIQRRLTQLFDLPPAFSLAFNMVANPAFFTNDLLGDVLVWILPPFALAVLVAIRRRAWQVTGLLLLIADRLWVIAN